MGRRRGALGDVTVWAERGSQHVRGSGSRFLLLEDGTRYEGRAGRRDYRIVTFKRLGQRVERLKIVRARVNAETLPTRSLDLTLSAQAAELQRRLSVPLLTLIGAFCSFGLARVRPRAGRFAKIVPGIILFVVYYLLCILAQDAIADGNLPASIGLWPVHATMVLLAIYLIRRSYRPI